MPSSITLDADLKAKLGKCKPGESKTFSVTVTANKVGDTFEGTVTNVAGYDKKEEETEMDMPGKKSKRAPAVAKAMESMEY